MKYFTIIQKQKDFIENSINKNSLIVQMFDDLNRIYDKLFDECTYFGYNITNNDKTKECIIVLDYKGFVVWYNNSKICTSTNIDFILNLAKSLIKNDKTLLADNNLSI